MSKDAGRSWAEFFLQHRGALTTYALALVGNAADAQDLIQDVLVRMVQQQRRVHSARAYVLRCLRNLATDRQRIAAVRPPSSALGEDGVAFLDLDVADLERREALMQLRTALNQLSRREREVIALKTYCGLTFQEIAEVLAQPLGTVTSHYRRGIDELRAICTRGEAHVP